MPLASYKPTEIQVEQNIPKVQPDNYHSVVVDDNQVSIRSLLPYVEGAPWSVNYYNQVVSKDNDIRELDPGQSNIYQQYQKIINLELKVTSALTDSYDTATAKTTVTGSATIYAGLIPNVGDLFITDVGMKRKGIFQLTNVERKSFNRESVYAIDYIMTYYVETPEGTSTFNELESKSIRTYHFSKDRLLENLQPLVTETLQTQIINLHHEYDSILTHYFTTFYNREYQTLILPGQDYIIYDPYLIQFILSITNSNGHHDIINIRELYIDKDIFMFQQQFWNLMTNRDYSLLEHVNNKMSLVSRFSFSKNAYLRSIVASQMDYIIYPKDKDYSVISGVDKIEKLDAAVSLTETTNFNNVLATAINDIYTEAGTTYNIIHPVLIDDYYILSNNFYNNTNNKSLLEILVKDYMNIAPIDINKLSVILGKYRQWARLEQYYYGPILLTLIKEAMRNN